MEYIHNTPEDRKAMMQRIGINSPEQLFAGIPDEARVHGTLDLPKALSELELTQHLRGIAARNLDIDSVPCFLGAGAYDHFIPAVVDHCASRSEFYTSYTPYQAEASQGILQTFFEFQTMICQITGMDVANASMYDGATALAEAVLMAMRIRKGTEVVVSEAIHPEYRQVLRAYLKYLGISIVEIGCKNGVTDVDALTAAVGKDTICVAVQNPNFFGCIEDLLAVSRIKENSKAVFIVCADPISLGLLKPPGECNADIVVGEGQALGNELAFGGPYLGFMACRMQYVRKLPGRIVGQTTDVEGHRAFALTLQTREQHIRREKATSNICSNHALMALRATVYMACMGREGLREVADLCLQKAHYAADQISSLPGFELIFTAPSFKEFAIRCPIASEELNAALLDQGIIGGLSLGSFFSDMKDAMLVCVTEKRTKEEIDQLVDVLAGATK